MKSSSLTLTDSDLELKRKWESEETKSYIIIETIIETETQQQSTTVFDNDEEEYSPVPKKHCNTSFIISDQEDCRVEATYLY